MQLPQINAKADSVTMVNAFLGVNKNETITDQEFADMKNITNDYFPSIGNRKKRGVIRTLTKPQALMGGKSIAYVDNDKLYYDETFIADLNETGEERQIIMMGAYLVVFPDGFIYNTYTNESETIENTTSASGVKITLTKLDGTVFDSSNTYTGSTTPSDTSKYWIDTSADPVVIKMYSASAAEWVSVPTTYVKFEAEGIGKGFSAYDAATFSGVDTGSWIYNGYDFNTSNIIYDCGDDYLTVAGFINMEHTNSGTVTIKRELPEMDYVCELDNRIWGCSSDNHEIYACKQGDPKNWKFYGGLDSDSYAATVGTQNDFTGAAAFNGYVFFFKEDGYHKIYGTKPSNYEMGWYPGRGVQYGSSKSICMVGDYLYFKARDGICVYDGSVELVSEALGSEPYYDAVAGSYRDKYYVTMRDADYRYRMYVYDTSKQTWTIEDDICAKYFGYSNNGLHLVNDDDVLYNINNEAIYTKVFPSSEISVTYQYPNDEFFPGNVANGELEGTVEWMMETGDIGLNTPYHKYIKRIILRLMLDTESKMKVQVMYDSSDEWIDLIEYYATRKRSYEIPVPVSRCDHMRIRISGFGEFKLFSIAKATEEGSGM